MITDRAVASTRREVSAAFLTGIALLAFLDSLFEYFWPANGIHGTEGALLVVVSTLLLAVGAGLIAARVLRGWERVLFEVLIFLDLVGTGVAAYFLENWVLVALDILALIIFIYRVTRPRRAALAKPAR